MGANRLLVLDAPQINDRVEALHQLMLQESVATRMFARDPARVILRTLFPGVEVPTAEIGRGNRLLYSLLSNESFLEWVEEYQRQLVEEATEAMETEDPDQALRTYLAITDRGRIHRDLATAVARTADPELIASLTWNGDVTDPDTGRRVPYVIWEKGPGPISDVAVDIETFVYAVAAVAVFAVAVVAVVAGRPVEGSTISRVDVQRVSTQMAEGLRARALEVREAGHLSTFNMRNNPYFG